MKKGLVELANLVIINKADGDFLAPANHTKVDYMHAQQLARQRVPDWKTKVMLCSALNRSEKYPVSAVWSKMLEFFDTIQENGYLEATRREKNLTWASRTAESMCVERLQRAQQAGGALEDVQMRLKRQLDRGEITPRIAAAELLKNFLK